MKDKKLNRRHFIKSAVVTAGSLTTLYGCKQRTEHLDTPTPENPIMQKIPFTLTKLRFPWQTEDPFLFCVYHLDYYPPGNGDLAPSESLRGRNIGSDFSNKNGWSMYHGKEVPGFPQHPHRGFETVTITKTGIIDHSDSLGATARFGDGDTQWMTAGRGILHSEMFPLLQTEQKNENEFFQIWLNLPHKDKFVEPYFTMFWDKSIPVHEKQDHNGIPFTIRTIAGAYEQTVPPAPPPNSWASDESAQIAIWTISIGKNGFVKLPAVADGVHRSLYFYSGEEMTMGQTTVKQGYRAFTTSNAEITLKAGEKPAEILLLQGHPIGEPVVKHGPFVMTSRQEIQQAFYDYQRTKFGGWPWPQNDPVHGKNPGRFAKHANGKEETPT